MGMRAVAGCGAACLASLVTKPYHSRSLSTTYGCYNPKPLNAMVDLNLSLNPKSYNCSKQGHTGEVLELAQHRQAHPVAAAVLGADGSEGRWRGS